MTNDLQPQKKKYLIMATACIALIGTCSFSFSALHRKKFIETEKVKLQLANAELRQQLVMLKNIDTIKNPAKPFNTAQIFNLVANSANQYQIRIKGFTPATDTSDLLINLIGTYPKAICFFEGIYQYKLGFIRKIELKKYTQEPNSSVEILVTLANSPEGGKPK